MLPSNINSKREHRKPLGLFQIVLFFLISAFSYAQSQSFEKIYLQLDNTVYTQGSTIWFKAIVTKGLDHSLIPDSGVLYVELIDSNEKVQEKKLVKLLYGVGEGGFELEKNMTQGIYLIRAYTLWNQNFDDDFSFQQYIRIIDPNQLEDSTPISNITLTKKNNGNNYVEALLNPFNIDAKHEKKPTVFITLDGKKDTLEANRSSGKAFKIGYPVNDASKLLTFKMQTSNGKQYSKTIALDTTTIDIQFFPESGRMVNGLQSKVGFKAIGTNGKGKTVQGTIVDENNTLITTFKSNVLGMGSFILPNVNSSKTYYAKVDGFTLNNLKIALPKVIGKGNVLSVKKRDEFVLLSIASNYIKSETLFIKASCRGNVLFKEPVSFKEGNGFLKLNSKTLPDGIVTFTLMNNNSEFLAERLYFNENLESKLQIDIETDKKNYAKRELTKVLVKTTGVNSDIKNSSVSLMAINKNLLGEMQNINQNIRSYFLLDSELKGNIENPGFYFTKDSTKYNDIDALLLTQGWRKYTYKKKSNSKHFNPENQLTVSGFAAKKFLGRDVKAQLMLKTYGKKQMLYPDSIMGSKSFYFEIDDEYSEKKINIQLECREGDAAGKKLDYHFQINKKLIPSIAFNHKETIAKIDSILYPFIEHKKEESINEGGVFGDVKYKLKNVTVTEELLSPSQKIVYEKYGKPDVLIQGEDIVEKEQKWSSGLFMALNFAFPEEISWDVDYPSNPDSLLNIYNEPKYINLNNGLPTIVIVDSKPVVKDDYKFLESIDPSGISDIEIIRQANNFDDIFRRTFPFSKGIYINRRDSINRVPKRIPTRGNIIALYTYGGKGFFELMSESKSKRTSIDVFSPVKEFYAPKYKNLKSNDWDIPDLRSLVYWQPRLKKTSTGVFTVSFYNTDILGDMLIVVEAISIDGKIGYNTIEYTIIDNKANSQ